MIRKILMLMVGGISSAQAQVPEFESLTANLNLNAPGYSLSYKDGGTSVGLKIKYRGEKFGKWVPNNSATNVEAQVVSYELARFLAMPGLVVPSAYYVLTGAGLESYRSMLQSARETNKWRIYNREEGLKALAQNPQSMLGVFTPAIENFEVEGLANPAANTIRSSHPIAAFIRADGPLPGAEILRLSGAPKVNGQVAGASALNLAQEFSRIMVLDILTGQWDRWSGGNVEAQLDPTTGEVHFLARDNGGASMRGRGKADLYFKIVTRFDAYQISLVEKLVRELRANPVGTAQNLKLRSSPKSLLSRAEALLSHVQTQVQTYGADRVFFPDPN